MQMGTRLKCIKVLASGKHFVLIMMNLQIILPECQLTVKLYQFKLISDE
jgi:hypothetical protein